MRIDKSCLVLIFLGLALTVQSQNLGLSSYSRIGIGDIAETGTSRNVAMGGAGVASYHQFQINGLNPASIAVLKYTNFEFDVAGKRTTYLTSGGATQKGTAGNFQYLALAMPLHRRFVVQLGAKPYSTVNYRDTDYTLVIDKNNPDVDPKYYHYEKTGSGGLSDIFAGAAYNYKDWLLAGISGGLIIGQSTYENTLINGNLRNSNFFYKSSYRRSEKHFRISPGLLITREIKNNKADLVLTDSLVGKKDSLGNQKKVEVIPVSDNWFYGLGFTASFFRTIDARELGESQYDYYYDNLRVPQFDTVSNISIDGYKLPASFRVGLSVYKPNKLNFVLDYHYTDWSTFTHNQLNSVPVKQSGVAFGAEYTPDYNSIKYYKRVAYRGGINASQMPFKINGQSLTQVQATLGAGLMFPKTGVTLNLSLTYGQRGTTASDLVKENYFMGTIGVISNTRWFVRRKHE